MAAPERPNGQRGTSTSRFGVSRRESHDASDFYRRFKAPVISDDEDVAHPRDWCVVDQIIEGDMRAHPEAVTANSVALVVTSPPYYSGKEYEAAVGQGHIPASYEAYLKMLHGVFAACIHALEPGGRIAVNVANLGRKPYRSLSRDLIDIFEDLELLVRGEIIWQKARGAAGSCAWGTFQKPGDPVLRDLTERVVIASKGRFDRALDPRTRHQLGLPSEATIYRDEFLEATTDVWELGPESAARLNHPAPFPVELPLRLIDLYTYRRDLVLDPFMGSGTTAVAALRTDRRYLGFDTDTGYVAAATARADQERQRLSAESQRHGYRDRRPLLPAIPDPDDPAEDYQSRGVREGRRARELAKWALEDGAFAITTENKRLDAGVTVNFVAEDLAGGEWFFDVSGAFTSSRAGLLRTDTLWKALGKATVIHHTRTGARYVLLTTDKPLPNSAGTRALDAVTGRDPKKPIFDVIGLRDVEDLGRLHSYGQGRGPTR